MNSYWRRFAPIGLYLAGLAVLVSLGLYFVQRSFSLPLQISLGMIVAGLALFAFLDPNWVRRALTGRQARHGSNALVLSVAFVGILTVINVWIYQNPKRWDLTEDQQNTLAPETLDTLASLPEPVTATAFFSSQTSSQAVQDLLDNYKFYSNGKFDYTFIDPIADPVAAEAAKITRDSTIVLKMGTDQEQVTALSEQEITAGLVRLISGENKVVYFLTGHGEYSPDESGEQGYSQIKRILESKNYIVQSLNLLAKGSIPADARLIVIAGAMSPLAESEVNLLADYLAGGGALIDLEEPVLFREMGDQPDPFAAYLQTTWGFSLAADVVVDLVSPATLGQDSYLFAPLGAAYQAHEITQEIQNYITVFPTTRSVQVTKGETGTPVVLVSTADQNSWAETDLEGLKAGGQPGFDDGADRMGPVPLMAAAEHQVTQSRVAVFGDADFAANAYLTEFYFSANGNLFVNTVDWAVGQEDLINLTPQNAVQRMIQLPSQPYMMNLIQFGVVFFLPGIALVTGIAAWIRRKRRG
jgi:ABC-type uncharacterized transport system involved in gliding motility auxiliary subunit